MEARYQELANRIGLGHTKLIPKLFEMVADVSEADMLLAMPGDSPALAEKLGISEEKAEEMVQLLFHKGLVFPSFKTDPPTWRMCRDLVQFHDATILWPEAPRDFLDLWQEFMELEWPDYARQINQMIPRPFTRVIPVGAKVEAKAHVLAFEDIEDIIAKAKKLAVTKCTCRLIAHKCDKPLEVCVQINNAASYSINRGTGRELTKQEALDLMKFAEEAGLVHVVMNKQNVDHFICNCCSCCCQTFPILLEHGISVIEPSRFAAKVDPDVCTACETCLERCYFGAITVDDTAEVNPEKCLGCGLCQITCPTGAITLEEVRGTDFVPEKVF